MKVYKVLLVIFCFGPILLSFDKHEYYVSVTNIEYAEEQNSIQIISQIFIDDFEIMMRQRFDEGVTLAAADESPMVENYMQRYLSDKLLITINGEEKTFDFIGKEYKDDIAYCYLEIQNVDNIESIAVKNRILFDIYEDQQNIVRLKLLGKNRSFLLIPDNDNCLLNFN